MNANIITITIKPKNVKAPEQGYLRVSVDAANLIVGHGIEGDSKGGSPKRQLNIMSLETMRELEREGYSIAAGALGEQMVIDGLDVRDLPVGTQLQLGGEAMIEVTSLREGCERFEAHQGKPKAAGRIGIMARVVRGGRVQVGDTVQPV